MRITGICLLRIAVAIILFTHSVPGIFNGGIHDFGQLYLNQAGFAPFGVHIAWAIKLSHIICALMLLFNRYIKVAAMVTIVILVMGIIMVHFKEGWFVVGGGRNGMEFNFLLIVVLVAIVFPNNISIKNK